MVIGREIYNMNMYDFLGWIFFYIFLGNIIMSIWESRDVDCVLESSNVRYFG